MSKIAKLFFITVLAVAPLQYLWAQAQAELNQKLSALHQQIQFSTSRISTIKKDQSLNQEKIYSAKKRLDLIIAHDANLAEELLNLRKSENQIQLDLVELKKNSLDIERASMARVKALYQFKPFSFFESLINQNSSSQLSKNAYYLSKIKRLDRQLIEQIIDLKQQKKAKLSDLNQLITRKQILQKELSEQKSLIAALRFDLEKLDNSLNQEKQRLQQSLNQLKAQVLRFETVLVSLTSGQSEETDLEKEQAAKLVDSAKSSGMKASLAHELREYQGQGLTSNLSVPIKGQIIVGFGSKKHQEFDTMVFNKGIEYSSQTGAEIKSVARGRVIYLGRLAGYGTVIIIDHGQRFYSLYGRLASTQVELAQEIDSQQLLGHSGQADEKGRNFYFEIRHDGQALDPAKYLVN